MSDVTDPPKSKARPKSKTVAERAREYRSRKKRKKVLVTIEVDPGEAADVLADLRLLEEWSTDTVTPTELASMLTAAHALRKKLKL
jgi:hypothetical protein